MVTPIPALLGGGFTKPITMPILAKKIVQPKVPALLRKDTPVYTKTSS